MDRLKIKKLISHSDFEKLLFIQKAVWKHKDIDLTPIHHFNISVKTGAILLGAFLDKKMVGFVYSFPAIFGEKIAQHSHQLAVLPQYQGQKIGKKLKLAQRDSAIKLGYNLITWTADPLVAKNANFNLHTLGAVAKTYLPNFYKAIPALSLLPNIPIDRFLIEWQIKDNSVEKRKKKKFDHFDIDDLPKALHGKYRKNKYIPYFPVFSLSQKYVLIEILKDVKTSSKEPDVIFKWQRAIHRVMTHYFSTGYYAVDFIFYDFCYYVLEKISKSIPCKNKVFFR